MYCRGDLPKYTFLRKAPPQFFRLFSRKISVFDTVFHRAKFVDAERDDCVSVYVARRAVDIVVIQ